MGHINLNSSDRYNLQSTKSIEELEDLAVTYFSRLLQGDRKVLQKMEKEASKETLSLKNTADKGKYVYLQGNDSRANVRNSILFHTTLIIVGMLEI